MGAGLVAAGQVGRSLAWGDEPAKEMAYGLVTYLWGKDWDVPTLIRNCTTAKLQGVELRTGHAHKVEPNLTAVERAEVKKRFADSPVALVGIGTAEEFHSPDPAQLAKAIEATKAYIKLGHDVGGSGVKVRPNNLPKGVPEEKTIEQIGKSLNLLGAFAADFGQQIRLEIHGGCARIPIVKRIIDVADSSQRRPVLELERQQPGGRRPGGQLQLAPQAVWPDGPHPALDSKDYPFAELIALFVQTDYRGWILSKVTALPRTRWPPALPNGGSTTRWWPRPRRSWGRRN